MYIKLYITGVWIFIILMSAILAKYQKLSFPSLKKRENLVFLILETLTLFVGIGLKEWTENQYEIICGSLLLLFGWIISHQSLLHKNFKAIKANKYLQNINSFFVGSSSQDIYFSGDWLQLAGLALIWGSHYSILVFFVTYSIFVYSISTIEIRNFNRKFENQTGRIKNDTFRAFTKIIFRNAMAASFPLVIFVTHAVLQRKIILFFGTFQDAVGLLTTLAQAETTVLALAITFLFVLVEFTNSAYSPRLVQSFTRQWPFKIMVFFACLSIVTKFAFIANAARYIALPKTPDINLLMDWTLLCTILSMLAYFIFIRNVILMMSPEAVVKQILKDFNEKWMETVRKKWGAENTRKRRLIYNLGFIYFINDNDPMVLFERYLATTAKRDDTYSVKTALIALHDTIKNTTKDDDGAIIDNYLFDRLENFINVLARNHDGSSLNLLCSAVSDTTILSEKVLKDADFHILDVPVGTRMLQSIAKTSIEFNLENPARAAIISLGHRCDDLVLALPSYSELWLINEQNRERLVGQEIAKEEIETLSRNDGILNSLLDGYFAFFVKLGQQAIKQKLRGVVWTICDTLLSKINFLIEHVEEKPYRRYIILRCLWSFENIVQDACEAKFQDGIYFGPIAFGLDKLDDEDTGMLVANSFAEIVERMAKAGILNRMDVIDIAVMTVYLAKVTPQIAIPILNSFGIAGEAIKQSNNYLIQERGKSIQIEILGRIEQVEKAALAQPKKGFKVKISGSPKCKKANKANG